MFNLNLFKNIGAPLYLIIYLIFPYSAITQTLKVDFINNLEKAINARDLEFIKKSSVKLVNARPTAINLEWAVHRMNNKLSFVIFNNEIC